MRVVGVDGCRGGWISSFFPDPDSQVEFGFHRSLSEIVATFDDAACIAVDIPIGLAEGEPRRCDIEARKLLGNRKSSVFPAPDRRVLEAFARGNLTYRDTNSLAKEITGKGLPAQTYNILDKVAEADSLLIPKLQKRIAEVHPELSFSVLAGHPMHYSKKKPEGFAERLSVLKRYLPELEVSERSAAGRLCHPAKPDDVLDAVVAAVSAWRTVRGEAIGVPSVAGLDSRDLEMRLLA